MADSISLGAVSHVALTVTDLTRARDFYTRILGFGLITELGPGRVLLGNGSTVLALTLPSDGSQPAPQNDRFHENRCGLDHLSFSVGSHADLENAAAVFDANGVSHGTINDLSGVGLPMYVMSFRDPDNIQLELTAPKA
jgi:glyoxylase I family protein